MNTLNILMIAIGIYFFFKFSEGFVNFSQLGAFGGNWGDHESIGKYKPTKTSKILL